jgi:hypothetical protein
LETLRFFSAYVHYSFQQGWWHIRTNEWEHMMTMALDMLPLVPQVEIVLAQVILNTPPSGYSISTLRDTLAPRERRQDVYKFAFALTDRGRKFKLFTEAFPGGDRYIPPYLHGEDAPVERLVYDAEEPYVFHTTERAKFQKDADEKDKGYGGLEAANGVIVLGLTG